MVELTEHPRGTVVAVRVQPGAKREQILGERAGSLRLAVTAVPERGRANEAVRSALAEAIGCKLSQVELLAGPTAREKRFLIEGWKLDELRSRIDALLANSTR